jgi:hypothetical protein
MPILCANFNFEIKTKQTAHLVKSVPKQHVMKAYRVSGSKAPRIRHLGTKIVSSGGKESPVPTGQEVQWASDRSGAEPQSTSP